MKTERPMQRPKVIPSDPAWEAMKASRRNLTHDEAVQLIAFLHRQYRSLCGDQAPVDVYTILRTLTAKRIAFVLTGAHGFGAWTGRPRNTHDVDILVNAGRSHAPAIKAMQVLYPELEVTTSQNLTAFFIPGEKWSVIDVGCP